jgi:hypothetical protein
MDPAGGDLLKGLEDEAALEHPGMGDLELRKVHDLVPVEKDVEIQGTGSILLRARAPEKGLDLGDRGKESRGRQGGPHLRGTVQVLPLGRASDGLGLDEVRDADHFHALRREELQAAGDVLPAVAEIGAEPEEH